MDGLATHVEKGLRSVKYTVKYGTHIKIPKMGGHKEEPVDTRMRRLYMMPMPKSSLMHNASGFEDDEDNEEEEDDDGGPHGVAKPSSGGGLLSGFQRAMLKPASSSMSDSSSFSARSSGSTESTSRDEKPGDEEETEEEDDDGFGTMNISTKRLPQEDTALTRFIKRAMVNNSEAVQISTLKNMELVMMPRSEEEILATLDQRFYQEQFDPALHMLESFPGDVDDFNTYIEKQLSERDVAKDYVMSQLATRVEANYHVLIEGMKNIQEVDLDLVAAGVQAVNSRRKLGGADKGMRLPFLKVISKRVRRENLQRVANIVKAAHKVLLLERDAKEAAAAGRYDKAVIAATDAKLALDSELLQNANMMESTRQGLEKLLPSLRLEVDKSLRRLCAKGFNAAEYSWVLKAYLTLDDHGVRINSRDQSLLKSLEASADGQQVEDTLLHGILLPPPAIDRGGVPGLCERIQRFMQAEMDYSIKSAVVITILSALSSAPPPSSSKPTSKPNVLPINMPSAKLPSVSPPPAPTTTATPPPPPLPDVTRDVHGRIVSYKGKKLTQWSIGDLLKQLPSGSGSTALRHLAQSVADVCHTYFLIMQWHRSPFNEQNDDAAYLHRPNAADQKTGGEMGDLSDEDEENEDDREPTDKRKDSKGGDEEEEEEDEDDSEEDTGFDSVEEMNQRKTGAGLDAAQRVRINQERRERLERARLATAARGLKQARRHLWELVDKTAASLVGEGSVEGLAVEAFVQLLATSELLVTVGEEFGRNESASLRKAIRHKAKLFFERTHQECFQVLRQMLDREMWYHVPISVADMGGISGVLSSHTKSLAWPSMNGSGFVVKERVLRAARKRAGDKTAEGPLPGVLHDWPQRGNPFVVAPPASPTQGKSKEPAVDTALVIFDPSEAVPCPSPSTPQSSTPTSLSHSGSTPRWTITQAALNGFAKYTSRYMQLMSMAPALSVESYAALCDLLEFYVYMVFAIFVPEQVGALLLAAQPHIHQESTTSEELQLVNNDILVPLPCEAEELGALKAFLSRVKDDMIESEALNILVATVETAKIVKKLGADTASTAKKYMGTAIGGMGSAMGAMASGMSAVSKADLLLGGATAAGQGAAQSATLQPQQHHPPQQQQQQQQQQQLHAPPSGPQTASPATAEGPQGSKSPTKKIKVHRPAMIAEALEDEASLFGLSQRAVAVDSCLFIIEVLKWVQPKVHALLGKNTTIPGNRGSCDTYLSRVVDAVTQLRTLVYRCAAPRLVGAGAVARQVEGQQWTINKLKEEPNTYTESLCTTCRDLWTKIHGPEHDSDGRSPVRGGLDNTYIPQQVHQLIWAEVVQAAMCALLEGFSRVEKCSTEGRALMSMDLQALQVSLDEIQRVRPGRGKVYVENYVKAFYYGEADVVAWITQNWKAYHFRQMAGLLTAGVGQKKKKKGLKDLVVQVQALYHPEKAGEQSSSIL